MAIVITIGGRYVLDESAGLQNAPLNPADNDVDLGTLPGAFRSYLNTLNPNFAFALANGVAMSASNAVTVTSPGPITALTLHDSSNGALDGDDSGILTVAGNHVFLYATPDPHIVVGREGNGANASLTGDVVFAVYLDAAADNRSATLWSIQFEAIKHPVTTNPDDVVDLGQSLKIGATSGPGIPAPPIGPLGLNASIAPSVSVSVTGEPPAFAFIGQAIGFGDDGPSASLTLTSEQAVTDESTTSRALDGGLALFNDETTALTPVLVAGATRIGYDQAALVSLAGSSFGTDGGGSMAVSLEVAAVGIDSGLNTNAGTDILLYKEGSIVVGRAGGPAGAAMFAFGIDQAGLVTVEQYRPIAHLPSVNADDLALLASNVLSARIVVTDSDGDTATTSVALNGRIGFEDDGPAIDQSSRDDLKIGNTPGVTVSGDFILYTGNDTPATFNIISAPTTGGFSFAYADVNNDGITGQNEIIGKLNGVNLYSLITRIDGHYDFKLLSAIPGGTTRLDLSDIKAGGPDTNFIDVGALNSTDFVEISGYFDADGPGGNPRGPAAVNESNANVGVRNGNLDANETLSFRLFDANHAIQDISGISIGTKTPSKTNYTYTAFDNGVVVFSGSLAVNKNGTIDINAPSGVFFDTVDVVSVNGNAVKVGLGDIVIRRGAPDLFLNFGLRLTDADTDSVDTAFSVAIDGNGDGLFPNAFVTNTSASVAVSQVAADVATPVHGLYDMATSAHVFLV
jgi:Domain of unknown function (DUF5801)